MASEDLTTPGAVELAAVPEQYLTFWLGREVFAIGIRAVREIIQHAAMTVVPLMPDFVRGVINLRGSVVPVIDLKMRFGREATQVGAKTCIIIFDASRESERLELGLMVDAVSEVIELRPQEIELPPQFGTSIQREFVQGLGKVNGQFVVILEPDRALDVDDMATRGVPLDAIGST